MKKLSNNYRLTKKSIKSFFRNELESDEGFETELRIMVETIRYNLIERFSVTGEIQSFNNRIEKSIVNSIYQGVIDGLSINDIFNNIINTI